MPATNPPRIVQNTVYRDDHITLFAFGFRAFPRRGLALIPVSPSLNVLLIEPLPTTSCAMLTHAFTVFPISPGRRTIQGMTQLPLPAYRVTDPSTSRDAARSMRRAATAQCAKVLTVLRANGELGAEQIATLAQMDKWAVCRRLPELQVARPAP